MDVYSIDHPHKIFVFANILDKMRINKVFLNSPEPFGTIFYFFEYHLFWHRIYVISRVLNKSMNSCHFNQMFATFISIYKWHTVIDTDLQPLTMISNAMGFFIKF